MNRKDRVALDVLERALKRFARGNELTRALHKVQGRVAFVQVVDRWINAECAQGADAADAEHHLLVQAHLAATHIQDVGDRAIGLTVGRDVGVEEEHGDATNLRNPYRRRDASVAKRNRNNELLTVYASGAREGQQREINLRVGMLLMPIGINGLAEISAPVEESNANEREGHI